MRYWPGFFRSGPVICGKLPRNATLKTDSISSPVLIWLLKILQERARHRQPNITPNINPIARFKRRPRECRRERNGGPRQDARIRFSKISPDRRSACNALDKSHMWSETLAHYALARANERRHDCFRPESPASSRDFVQDCSAFAERS